MIETKNLPNNLGELVSDFNLLQDENERVDMLLFYADKFEEVPSSVADRPFNEDYRVPACESEAYVWSELRDDGTVKFYFAVENPQGISAKAYATILDETLSGTTPENIINIPDDLVYEFFGKKLSMGKNMGLKSMLRVVKSHAKQYVEKQDN